MDFQKRWLSETSDPQEKDLSTDSAMFRAYGEPLH